MRTLRFKHVDAFTSKPFAGNYAGVVLDADSLTDAEMQQIARETNMPETAFILSPTVDGANIRIRWFSPSSEVPLCGHATIASFHALAEDGAAGMNENGQHYFKVQTKSGVLTVCVEKNFHGIQVEFTLPLPRFSVKKKLPGGFLKSLGLAKDDLHPSLPVVRDQYLYIPVKGLRTLRKITPDPEVLGKLTRTLRVLGVSLFTLETVEKTSAVHSRFFAPELGIVEDPVTGSANGPLGVYLYSYVLPAGIRLAYRDLPDNQLEYIGEQGDEIHRAGRVKIRLRLRQSAVEAVSIAGEAITIVHGSISI